MGTLHQYPARIRWTGNRGHGTVDYRAYGREFTLSIDGKPDLLGSSDRTFRGDASRHNPEELLVAALSACHLLSYLHACARAGVVVVEYEDSASGSMESLPDDSGRFTEVTLRPRVTIDGGQVDEALRLHDEARRMCFIANSVNFPVRHEAEVRPRSRPAP